MSRDPDAIQSDIDQARDALGATLDQLVERTNPKRLSDQAKQTVQEWVVSPMGKKVIGGVVGTVATLVVISRIRRRRHR